MDVAGAEGARLHSRYPSRTSHGAVHNGPEMQKGTGIAASPHVTGLRLLIPRDRAAWFRRHAPLAPARACELRVGHRGRSIRSSPRKRAFFRPSVARYMTSPEGGAMEPCWIRFPERSIGFGFRFRGSVTLGSLFGPILRSICRLRGPIDFSLVHRADPSLSAFACALASASGSASLRRLPVSPRCLRTALIP